MRRLGFVHIREEAGRRDELPEGHHNAMRRHMLIFIKCGPRESCGFCAIPRGCIWQRWDHLVRIPMLTGSSRIFPASSNVLSRL
jgi:hypothetical protein